MSRLFFCLLSMLSILCANSLLGSCGCRCGEDILNGKIPEGNHRYNTFAYCLQLLCERGASTLVETGTSRQGLANCLGDGCSTAIFAEWVKNYGGNLYSVDINAQFLQNASDAIGDARIFVNFIHSDSVAFLQNFNHPIDFLYLDSYDYEFGNPGPSQQHHLNEIIAAYPWLTPNSIIMIDDCALPEGGKGKLVIEYLTQRGWRVIADAYQVILVQ